MLSHIRCDLRAALREDPAALTPLQVILLYPGFHAIVLHRIAHRLHRAGLFWLPHMVAWLSRFLTGIEIHPGAMIGPGLFIDHGMGVVVGETAVIGEDVILYHNVTLGGTGRERGKRHPTVCDGALIGAGATILGDIEVGRGSRVGAGAIVLESVPAGGTMVGVPARVVKRRGGHSRAEVRETGSGKVAGRNDSNDR